MGCDSQFNTPFTEREIRQGYESQLKAKQREIDAMKYERIVEAMAKRHYTPLVSLDQALDGKQEWECHKCGSPVVNTEVHDRVCPGRHR